MEWASTINRQLEKVLYFSKPLEDEAVMVSINNHFKGVLGFSGVSDLGFLLIFDIWYDINKGSGSTLKSMYSQNITISTGSSHLMGLCHNIWCNNSMENSFCGVAFVIMTFILFLP